MNLPVLFFFTTVLADLGPLLFHINFKISLSKSTESIAGVGSSLNLWVALGSLGALGF